MDNVKPESNEVKRPRQPSVRPLKVRLLDFHAHFLRHKVMVLLDFHLQLKWHL